ncbi:hypothetical protein PR048_010378 [Dryococelus australis]|uniref:Uncharacterized protein n=1 Tax=Dryococelus australis TaxID=614101 RepID=A0ABQ9I2K3_9NEOP|nr:hypothetical protein PR048_010378 [Dryococelus australis]
MRVRKKREIPEKTRRTAARLPQLQKCGGYPAWDRSLFDFVGGKYREHLTRASGTSKPRARFFDRNVWLSEVKFPLNNPVRIRARFRGMRTGARFHKEADERSGLHLRASLQTNPRSLERHRGAPDISFLKHMCMKCHSRISEDCDFRASGYYVSFPAGHGASDGLASRARLNVGAAFAERLPCSPAAVAIRVQSQAGSPPGFSRVGIVPDDAVGRRVFSGISRFLCPFIPALLHTHLDHSRLSRARFPVAADAYTSTSFFCFLEGPASAVVVVVEGRVVVCFGLGILQHISQSCRKCLLYAWYVVYQVCKFGAAPDCKVGGGGSPRKLVNQRQRPARLPHAKIREWPRRELARCETNRLTTTPPWRSQLTRRWSGVWDTLSRGKLSSPFQYNMDVDGELVKKKFYALSPHENLSGTRRNLTSSNVIQGFAVAERLACSPPIKAYLVQSPAGSLKEFSHVAIVPDDASGPLVFSRICR